MNSISANIALFAYLLSILLLLPNLLKPNSLYRLSVWIFTAIALVAHASFLYPQIFSAQQGFQLSLLNLGSVFSLFLCAGVVSSAWQNRGWLLLPVAYSFALINLLLASQFSSSTLLKLDAEPALLVHIGFALFAYSTLFIAMLYATFLAWVNYRLKHKTLPVGQHIPPLLQIERHLLYLTYIGTALLTITLVVGFIFLPSPFGLDNLHKTLLSSTAWLTYILLLWGNHAYGWRGIRFVRISYLGIILLSLAYLGNRLIVG